MCELRRKAIDRQIRSSSKCLKALNLPAGVFERSRQKSGEYRSLHALLCCDVFAEPIQIPRLHKFTSLLFDGNANRHTVDNPVVEDTVFDAKLQSVKDTIAMLQCSSANIYQNVYDTVVIAKDTVLGQMDQKCDFRSQYIDRPIKQFQLQSAGQSNLAGRNDIFTVAQTKPDVLRSIQKPFDSQNLDPNFEIKAVNLPAKVHYRKLEVNCISTADRQQNTVVCKENDIDKCQTEVTTRKRLPHKSYRKREIFAGKMRAIEEEFYSKPLHNAKIGKAISVYNRPSALAEYSNHDRCDSSNDYQSSANRKNENYTMPNRLENRRKPHKSAHFESMPIRLTLTYCSSEGCCDHKRKPAKLPATVNRISSAPKLIFRPSNESKSIQLFPENAITVPADFKRRLIYSTRAYLRSLRDYTVAELLRLEAERVESNTVNPACCELLRLYKRQCRRAKTRRYNPDPEIAILDFEKEAKYLQSETIRIQNQLTLCLERKAFERTAKIGPPFPIIVAEHSSDAYLAEQDHRRTVVVPSLDLSSLAGDAPIPNQNVDKSLSRYEEEDTVTPRDEDTVTPRVPPDSGNTSDGISSIREFVNDAQISRKLARWDNQILMRLTSTGIDEPHVTHSTVAKSSATTMGRRATITTIKQTSKMLRTTCESNHTVVLTPYRKDSAESGRASIAIATDGSSTVVGSAQSIMIPSARESADMLMDSLKRQKPRNGINDEMGRRLTQADADGLPTPVFFGNLCRPSSSAYDLATSLDWPENLGQINVEDEPQADVDEDFWFDKFPFDEKKREIDVDVEQSIKGSASLKNDSNVDPWRMIDTDRSASNGSIYSPTPNLDQQPINVLEHDHEEDGESDRSAGDERTFSELDNSYDIKSNYIESNDSHSVKSKSSEYNFIAIDAVDNEMPKLTDNNRSASSFENESWPESLPSANSKKSSHETKNRNRVRVHSSDSAKSTKSLQKLSVVSYSNTETSIHEDLPDNSFSGSGDMSEL